VRTPTKIRQTLKRSKAVVRRNKKDPRRSKTKVEPSKKSSNLNLISLDREGGGKDYEIRLLPKKRHLARGVNLLTSERWIKTPKAFKPSVKLPYIDVRGKFTGTNLYQCDLTPQGYISTVISTILRRVKFWVLRRNSISEWNKRQNILLKCSAYYAMTKNVYFWDRILALTKSLGRNWKSISSLLHSVSSKLDDHKWFVYGHVCLQTQWLTSRAVRPRDKSAHLIEKDCFLLPISIRGRKEEIARFSYDSVWQCFVSISQI
jgi:hypothetical protein